MTLAPRVQVYTQLSCNALYGHDVYDHTSSSTAELYNISSLPFPFYSTLDPSGPHLNSPFNTFYDSPGIISVSAPVSGPLAPGGDDDEPDPRNLPSKRCLSDPKVQAGAARIQTVMTTIMGTLSALTTGWWGHFGERYGRTRVLAASTLGLFLT